MLDKLINKFEELKRVKIEKFSGNRDKFLIDDESLEKVDKLMERYEYDVFALCDLEPYFKIEKPKNKNEQNYLSLLISYLIMYKTNPEIKLDADTEYKIRNDEYVIEALVDLETRLSKGAINSVKYEPVIGEVEELELIIHYLKEQNPEDYINQEIIKMIYDYLSEEKYISYHDKYIEIWRLIGEHNINVSAKRTRL